MHIKMWLINSTKNTDGKMMQCSVIAQKFEGEQNFVQGETKKRNDGREKGIELVSCARF
jgi:hypothetical protein